MPNPTITLTNYLRDAIEDIQVQHSQSFDNVTNCNSVAQMADICFEVSAEAKSYAERRKSYFIRASKATPRHRY